MRARELVAAVGALGALAVGVAFVAVDPASAVTTQALSDGGRAAGAAAAGLATCWWAGRGVLARLEPALLHGPTAWLHCVVVGLLAWGLLLLLGCGLAPLGPALLVLATAILVGVGLLGRGQPLAVPPLTRADLAWLLLLAVPAAVVALAPPLDTDELYYHLALPHKMLQSGGLVGGFLNPSGSRPMALHLPFTALLWAGGESAPRLFHLGLAASLVVGANHMARERGGPLAGHAAAALLVGSYSVTHDAGLAANNLPTAVAVLAVLDAADRGRARALALAAGAALSLKYTAAAAMVGLFLTARVDWRRRVVAGVVALLLVSPWWARNLLEGLHPLFPFAGWPTAFPFQYLEKYGDGRALVDLLLLPWNAVMTAEITSNRFLGRVSPLWLVGGVASLGALAGRNPRHARLVGACAIILVGWAAGPHWLRYLLPGIGPLAIAAGVGLGALAGLPESARGGALVVGSLGVAWLAGAPANLGPMVDEAADRLDAARGAESRDDFYAKRYLPWPAIAWANAHLPADAKVALLFDWSGYLIDRQVVLGSVEDHVPVRHWVLTHGDRSLDALQKAGVTHVMVRRARFLRKIYPFLSEDHLDQWFDAPVEHLDELLLLRATLVFQAGTNRVYRLDPPNEQDP